MTPPPRNPLHLTRAYEPCPFCKKHFPAETVEEHIDNCPRRLLKRSVAVARDPAQQRLTAYGTL